MQLSWQPGFSVTRKPAKRPTARRSRKEVLGADSRWKSFEFVVENPRGKHGTSPTRIASAGQRASEEPVVNNLRAPGFHTTDATLQHGISLETAATANSEGAGSQSVIPGGWPFAKARDTHDLDQDHESQRSSEDSPVQEILSDPEASQFELSRKEQGFGPTVSSGAFNFGRVRNDRQVNEVEDLYAELDSLTGAVLELPGVASNFARCSHLPTLPVPRGILHRDLVQRFSPILERYDNEFCKIPLTSDLSTNPFRCRSGLQVVPSFLVHAIMALAGHHVGSSSALSHRHAAIHSLRESLDSFFTSREKTSLLDAVMVLFSLDETQSALGSWHVHLLGALTILENIGGVGAWRNSPRTEVQVALLTWWDAIISLVSRENCVFPYSYFQAVLSNHSRHQWDFFGLCGCPTGLVEIVMQLAHLSPGKHASTSMRRDEFDIAAISKLEEALESWHHIFSTASSQDEESLHQDHDTMHCSEAWRNGLILYVYRVFHWKHGDTVPSRFLHCARLVVDHVTACREEAMVSRQALLPLFFAGCELRDPSMRAKILGLCSLWDHRTKYHVFNSAIPLLREVWSSQEQKGFENVWWGEIIDRQHVLEPESPLQLRICFG